MSRARLAVVAIVLAAIWLAPHPPEISPEGWRLLAVFAATIVGLILRPLPMGAVVLLGVTASIVVGAVPYRTALSGFANGTVWLIVVAFLFARAFLATGLGRRIAFLLVRACGHHTLGLAYSLVLADLLLAPATPSNTARAGGILFPVVRSLATAFDSQPGPTARRIGAFLVKSTYQCDVVTSAMFLTAMAANPLAVELAGESAGVELSWAGWTLAALLPGLVSLAAVPLVLYRLYPPEVRHTPEALELARRELATMGPWSSKEKALLVVFAVVLGLWSTSRLHGLATTAVALLGLSALLLLDVLGWSDVLGERGAWDALVWFGGLVMMAAQLNQLGVIGVFADAASARVSGLPWLAALVVLLLVYLYAHYAFASMTAHVTALYPAFLAVAIGAGAPPLLAALSFAFFSSLNASLTHYATGPAPIYFGSGYVALGDWWRLGFLLSLLHVVVWIGLGFPYWKALGIW